MTIKIRNSNVADFAQIKNADGDLIWAIPRLPSIKERRTWWNAASRPCQNKLSEQHPRANPSRKWTNKGCSIKGPRLLVSLRTIQTAKDTHRDNNTAYGFKSSSLLYSVLTIYLFDTKKETMSASAAFAAALFLLCAAGRTSAQYVSIFQISAINVGKCVPIVKYFPETSVPLPHHLGWPGGTRGESGVVPGGQGGSKNTTFRYFIFGT